MERQSQPLKRRNVACERCRSLKVRCIQVDAESKCLKCTKSGHACNMPIRSDSGGPVYRKKRPRLVDLDLKLNGILAQLSGTSNTDLTDANDTAATTTSGPVPEPFQHALFNQASSTSSWPNLPTQSPDLAPAVMPHFSVASETALKIELHCSPHQIEQLLDRFRQMQAFFPFVIIPADWTSVDMFIKRPFLLLAAITNSAMVSPEIAGSEVRDGLSKQFKETLASRVIVDGENSLDLLQGLMIHLAWFQYHMIPRSQQAYRLLQVAISMLVDRGLHHPSQASIQAYLGNSSERGHNETFVEILRASLGCFYLSSVISAHMGRPNVLPMNDYVFKSVTSVQQDAQFESDQLLLPMLKLQRILEDAGETFQSNCSPAIHSRIYVHVERILTELEMWSSSLSPAIRFNDLLTNGYHAARIRIYEMGLIYHCGVRTPLVFMDKRGPDLSRTESLVTTSLTKCVDAIKLYLDQFLSMESYIDDRLPFEEWCRLTLALFVAYKLSVQLIELPSWDARLAQETLDLDFYLETFVSRLRRNCHDEDLSLALRNGSLYTVFPEILDSARTSFAQTRDHPHRIPHSERVHINLLGGEHNRNSESTSAHFSRAPRQGKCPVTGFWTREAPQVDLADGFDWLNWPSELPQALPSENSAYP